MKCPRCQVELDDDQCPKCNWSIQPVKETKEEIEPENPPQEARSETIGFPIEFVTSQTAPAVGDWRNELKKKLEQHYRKGGDTSEELDLESAPKERKSYKPSKQKSAPGKKTNKKQISPDATDAGAAAEGETASAAGGEVVRQLFRYKLGDVAPSPERRIVTFERESKSPEKKPVKKSLEKPVIRPPLKARSANPPSGPQQGKLSLEQISKSIQKRTPPQEPVAKTEPVRLSKEVLLSRVLALIVDLVVAVVSGSLFAFIASTLVGSPFPSPETIQLALGCGVVFFFMNAILFQSATGQTPGMMWTDLKLVGEDEDQVRLRSVLIRTVALPISILTVLGLLWAFADSRCRCWHDRLSGSYVVPGYFSTNPYKKTSAV